MGLKKKIKKAVIISRQQGLFVVIYTVSKRILHSVYAHYCTMHTWIKLKGNGVIFSKWGTHGIPMVNVEPGGKLILGNNFHMNNGRYFNKIGRQQPSIFAVDKCAILSFGENVGISHSAFFCTTKITIGNNVKIGGNCVFYDTDFHSLNHLDRRDRHQDSPNRKSLPVIIEDDVFIGAHCTILKGVTIGRCSIIGAGAVVTKSIPPFEIWGGNPARFIKSIK